jgi:plastocyanin/sugar lactone lactonase YvrE
MTVAHRARRGFVLLLAFAVLFPIGLSNQLLAQDATPVAGTPMAGAANDAITVVASGVPNPRAFAWNPNGDLYVSSAGIGGIANDQRDTTGSLFRIDDNGCPVTVASGFPAGSAFGGRFGLADVGFIDNTLYALGDGSLDIRPDAPVPNGLFRVNPDGSWQAVANVGAWVEEHLTRFVPGDADPGGEMYAMVSDGEAFWIAESNRGQILRVTPDGAITRVADLSENHPVPTGIALAPDGGVYVGFLTAFPYSDGAAKVVKVTADGQVTDVWTGLTAIVALAVAPDGTLYALEMTTDNPTAPPYYRHSAGRVVRQTGPSSLQEVVVGLDLPIAMSTGEDGGMYVALPALNEEGRPGGIIRIDVDATGNGVTAPADLLATTHCPELTPAMLAAPATPSAAAPVASTAATVAGAPIVAADGADGSVGITIDIDVETSGSGAALPGTTSCPDPNAAPAAATTVADQGTIATGDVTIDIAIDVETTARCPDTAAAMPTVSAPLPTPTATPASAPITATPVAAASVVETAAPGRAVAIAIRNFAFDPSSVTIPAGTTVAWTNDDQIAHTATSSTDVFNSGNLNLNQRYSYTFEQAGTFDYICIYHPYMKGTVIVE